MVKKEAINEQRVLLNRISWPKLTELLAEMGPERTAHLCYDHSRLELMTPSAEHERCSKLVESLLLVLADEMNIAIQVTRSALLLRPDLELAIQPQLSCSLSPTAVLHPSAPPDLILEVAFNRSSLDKLPLYANLGIPEVWLYGHSGQQPASSRRLQIYHLHQGQYEKSEISFNFPFLSGPTILQFLDQSDTVGLRPALLLLRDWLQKQN
uniref:Putative restriction endonuclease domain-containing protein n=1 Tax=Cyanothece sp. (strain PCC 7425 / ATCC 29141) TaxID=395961 RepID=B8HWX4_CYAP4